MTTANSRRSPLVRRIRRFHRAIWDLHRRRYRLLRRYHFLHAVWALPVITFLGAATGSTRHVDLWFIGL